jgi:hypothetical protein
MSKFLILVVVLAAVGVAGYLGYEAYTKNAGGASPAATSDAPGPQPGDPVTDASPDAVMGAVAAHRKKEDQDAQAAKFIGHWLPATGWTGPVQVITDESGGKAYRMQYTMTGLLTNEFWVVAVVPEGRQFYNGFEPEKRNWITFGGCIDKVDIIPASQYKPVPDYRIVVKDAYVVSIQGR